MLAERLSEEKSDKGHAVLARRLAKANTRRREQLFYWSKKPDQRPAPVRLMAPERTAALHPPSSHEEELVIVEAPDQHQEEVGNPVSVSSFAGRTFSLVALTDGYGAQTANGVARTLYAKSTIGQRRSNRVPDLPAAAYQDGEFYCPYCGINLSSAKMQDRQEWK